jgi:hypothetical protein
LKQDRGTDSTNRKQERQTGESEEQTLIGQKEMKINCRVDGKIEKLVSTLVTIQKNGIGKYYSRLREKL